MWIYSGPGVGGPVGEGAYGTMAAAGQLTPTIAAKGNKYYSLRPQW